MKDFVIFTDSSCDLPLNIIKEFDIKYLGLVCNMNQQEYIEDFGQSLAYKDFFNAMREGATPTTAQINSFRFEEAFEPYIKEGKAIMYIAFSSALSGTCHSSFLARNELLEKYPNGDISIIDTKAASGGVGLLVYNACIMKSQGKSKDDIVQWLEDNKLKICHFFTVDDLNHLKRGGRISATSAAIGGLLNIKPILFINNDGELKNFTKAKGKKKAIKILFENFQNHIINPEEQVIIITHGDCLEDAENLADMIRDKYTVKDIIINFTGVVIGSHAGCGFLSVFFLGDKRDV